MNVTEDLHSNLGNLQMHMYTHIPRIKADKKLMWVFNLLLSVQNGHKPRSGFHD